MPGDPSPENGRKSYFRRGQCFFGYAKVYRQFISGEFVVESGIARMIAGAGKSDGSTYPGGTMSNVWNTCSHAMDRGVKFALDEENGIISVRIAVKI